MTSKVNDLINAVRILEHKIISKNRKGYRVELAIYVSEDFYNECVFDISGILASIAYEFYYKNTISGYPVHIVKPAPSPRSCSGRYGPYSVHSPFTIVNLRD